MVKDHPAFRPPPPDVPLWRYLDFTKFVYMLESQSLFLTRADRFSDRFEGSFTLRDVRRRREWTLPVEPERLKRCTGISCWHLNEYESAAMWELYLKSDEGVALRSSYPRLCEALAEAEQDVHVGRVDYIDYGRDQIPDDSPFFPFLHKRRSFAHEREVRVIAQSMPERDEDGLPEQGLAVPIDLDRLIERIYVSPQSPDWFHELVEAVSARYGVQKETVRSDLSQDPLF